MAETSYLKQHWKLLLNIVTVIALLALAYAVRHQLADTLRNLKKVHVWALLLLIPVEWLNYDAQARMYRGLFKVVGNRISYKFLLKASLELNFVNNVFPSGGVSGISYFGMRMRSKDITGGKATVVQMMKLMLLFLSFEILLVLGLLLMAFGGHVNNIVMLATGSLSTLLLVGTVAFVMIIGSERRIAGTFTSITKGLNRVIHVVRPNRPETFNIERARSSIEELHTNYKIMESHYRELWQPFWWAFVANLAEVMAVYVVYIAFGEWVNLGSVILAYSVANFAGLVSVLPGGVGIYEALMTAVLAATGVPAAMSIPVTVMYRVLNMLIQLPPGYYYYHRTVISGKNLEPHA
ncbi:MAG TPA: lysylphosphatidylglycerol synthase transmembrane domain-containing protein [Candidatus Saccharimonadales bacterium]|nr:lysylphosphatidylglycerol synthase transmembrane domain-containing protein [Candidatus Saccharimonadales bacterium]